MKLIWQQDAPVADRPDVAASIEAFLRARSRVKADDPRFSRAISLWEGGYVDSIGMVELIGFLEDTFAVVVPDEVLFDPDFCSVNGIARIVGELTASVSKANGGARAGSSARAAGAGTGDSRAPA